MTVTLFPSLPWQNCPWAASLWLFAPWHPSTWVPRSVAGLGLALPRRSLQRCLAQLQPPRQTPLQKPFQITQAQFILAIALIATGLNGLPCLAELPTATETGTDETIKLAQYWDPSKTIAYKPGTPSQRRGAGSR